MTTPLSSFDDLADKRFDIPAERQWDGLINMMVFERGTRLFARRLADAGYIYLGDLHGKSVKEVLRRVPTTRRNFDRSLIYICGFGPELV
jgi:hypothetical protein